MRVVGVRGRERFVGESWLGVGVGGWANFFLWGLGVGGWFVGEIFPLKMP